MRVLIVDDEAPARRRLTMMLREIEGVAIAGEAGNGEDALSSVAELRPDVVLLDIEMPGGDGIQVASQLAEGEPPVIIFVTAFDHYAVQAFEHAAIDYLLKPVAFERMEAALARAAAAIQVRQSREQIAEMAEVIAKLRSVRPARTPSPAAYLQELWVQRRTERVRIEVARIDWIEAEHDYVQLHMPEGSYLLRQRISELEAALDPGLFVRIHRSTIVRRGAIRSVRRIGFGALSVVLANEEERRVGRKYAADVRDLMSG